MRARLTGAPVELYALTPFLRLTWQIGILRNERGYARITTLTDVDRTQRGMAACRYENFI